MGAIKKFLSNKTTITFVGIILGVAVLVGGYIYRVEKSVSSIRIPVAKRAMGPTEMITKDDIEYVRVNSTFISKSDVITEKGVNNLIEHFVSTGTSIPKGGVFYKSQIVEKKDLPNSIFDSIKQGYTIYQLKVDNSTTFANSIFPDDIIDLWIRTTSTEGKLIYQEFISDIQVLAVRDSSGQNVFDVTSGRTPAWLLFAVKTDMYRYLKIAEYLPNIEILPLPTNNYNTSAGIEHEAVYANKELKKLISDSSYLINKSGVSLYE